MKDLRILALIICITGLWSVSWSQVSVSLSEFSVNKGDTVIVPITVSDVSGYGIISYEIDLIFQETVLKPLEVDNQGTLTENWAAAGMYTEIPGRLEFGAYGGPVLAGAGTLTNVIFEVIGDYGDTTSLVFDSVEFNDNNPTAITNNGFLSIKLKPLNITVTTSIGSKADVIVDGQTQAAPYTTTWYPGTEHTLGVNSPQSGGNGIKYQFVAWSDSGAQTHTVAPTGNITYVAIMSTEYYMDLKSVRGNATGEGWYNEGDSVTITVEEMLPGVAGTQYQFAGWVGQGTGAYTGAANPAKFQIMGPVTETATWQTQFYLTVQTLPEGLAEIAGSSWYNKVSVAETGTAPGTITVGDEQRQFRGWKLDDVPIEGNPVSITMDTSHTAIADYAKELSIVVTTNKGVGTSVIVDGQEMDAPVSVVWTFESQHTIACPEAQNEKDGQRAKFVAWSDQGAREHSVIPLANTTYIAELKTEYQLNINTDPPEIAEIQGSGWYSADENINIGPAIQSVEYEGRSYTFYQWWIDSLKYDSNSISLVMARPMLITAKYLQNIFVSGQIVFNDIAFPNIKLEISGSLNDSVFTDNAGAYVFEGLLPGAYKITPKADGLNFTPEFYTYSMLFSNMKQQNFIASDIIPPEVELISPNGGEILYSEDTDSIRWIASDNSGIKSVSIFYSTDSGTNWTLVDTIDSFKNSYLWLVPDVLSGNCKIKVKAEDIFGNVAEDLSDEVFSIDNGSAVIETKKIIPKVFFVRQNYPNPFNSSTEIQYGLHIDSHVLVQIYNVHGQIIENIFDGYQSAGNYRINWNATDAAGAALPSGIYFYRIQAGTTAQTQRMILMR